MLDPEPSVPTWEPMLCSEAEEGQAPLSLELLYHAAQTTSPSDAIVVAGHLLMLETGFVPQVRLTSDFLMTSDLYSSTTTSSGQELTPPVSSSLHFKHLEPLIS